MSSLEWIEKQIKYLEKMCSLNPTFITKDLEYLYQIKTELEAWEVVKEFITDIGKTYVLEIDDWYCKNEYQTIKKALEGKYE